ncbi:DUF4158 domain-containing protein [Erwinia tracheiphila]
MPGVLGFAIQLKFRQTYGHYPESISELPSGMVRVIAEQIGCVSVPFEKLSSSGTTGPASPTKNIRRYLGVRLPNKNDITQLTAWLTEFILPLNPQALHGSELVSDWCQEQKIERPAADHLDRIIRSAVHQFETERSTPLA